MGQRSLFWCAVALLALPHLVTAQEVKSADLEITKTDASETAIAGLPISYSITVQNLGPDDSDALVTDDFPAILQGCSHSCLAAGGASCGAVRNGAYSVSETPYLPAGSSVTYQVDCSVPADATGSLSNTATVEALGGVIDGNQSNNSSTDVDTLTASSDLSIVLGAMRVASVVAGTNVQFDWTASNAGPSDSVGAMVLSDFPATLSSCTWSCSGTGAGTCATPAGSGDLMAEVDLPVGSGASLSATCLLASSATGQLSATAVIERPSGSADLDLSNNSATRVDPIIVSADLVTQKTDGQATVAPGENLGYTITVSNQGPSDVSGVAVGDSFPGELTGAKSTCSATPGSTCGAAGSGDLNDTANLVVGGVVTYLASAKVSQTATGTITNTATADAAAGVDPNVADNVSTDVDSVQPKADLEVEKDNGEEALERGGEVTYAIVVTNLGPTSIQGATVTDLFPAELTGVTWTCLAASGATCTAAGSGNINDTVDLPVNGSVTYTATATVDAEAQDTVLNTATAQVPDGVIDPNEDNNSASDEDTVERVDMVITMSTERPWFVPGGPLVYNIVVENLGPDDAEGARVLDVFEEEIETVSFTCSGTGAASCPDSGGGDLVETVDVPVGERVTFVVDTTTQGDVAADISNAASVLPPGGIPDTDSGNNNTSVTTQIAIFGDDWESSDISEWDSDEER